MTHDLPIRAPRRVYPGASAPFVKTRDVMVLTGATERQLEYWHAIELTHPEIRKSQSPTGCRFYDPLDVRRLQLIVRLTATPGHTARTKNGTRRLSAIGRVPIAAIERRWLLFSARLDLIGATDDKREAIRIATAAAGGVLLVELPALAGERAGAARG